MFSGNRTHNLLRCWRNALPLSHTGIYFFTIFFIQSDLQIKKSNYNYKLKPYKYYIHTFKKIEKLNKMTNAYNNISKLNI